MLPDRVSNPGPLTYESGALPTALHGPAGLFDNIKFPHLRFHCKYYKKNFACRSKCPRIIGKKSVLISEGFLFLYPATPYWWGIMIYMCLPVSVCMSVHPYVRWSVRPHHFQLIS